MAQKNVPERCYSMWHLNTGRHLQNQGVEHGKCSAANAASNSTKERCSKSKLLLRAVEIKAQRKNYFSTTSQERRIPHNLIGCRYTSVLGQKGFVDSA